MLEENLNDVEVEEEAPKELTEEEQKEEQIKRLKAANGFNTKKNFGVSYKKKRQKGNSQRKKSRRINRKR